MATIEYAVPITENEMRKMQGKSEILHVGLRDVDSDGNQVIKEFPVRKAHFNSLTASKKLAYALECAEFHHPSGADGTAKRAARRAAWDADDKAVADAAAEAARLAKEAAQAAAKAEQEAKFLFVATGIVTNDKKASFIQATVQHHGRTASFAVLYTEDKTVLEASLREAFSVWEAQEQAKEAFLASMSQTA